MFNVFNIYISSTHIRFFLTRREKKADFLQKENLKVEITFQSVRFNINMIYKFEDVAIIINTDNIKSM